MRFNKKKNGGQEGGCWIRTRTNKAEVFLKVRISGGEDGKGIGQTDSRSEKTAQEQEKQTKASRMLVAIFLI